MNKNFKLETGSKVAIVGGGPAGSFFAMYLMRCAREKNIHPEITIYQQRSFDELGPKGCKGCAGLLSISLLRNLSELGLTIPEEVIQSKVEQYAVHSPYLSFSISNPETDVEIASVYRGGGPRVSSYEKLISFDGWLLRQAQSRGATVVNQGVSGIYLEHGTGVEVEGERTEYDLVVLATGVNAKPVPIQGLEYISPKTQTMAQDEIYVGVDEVRSRLGNVAHAFLIPHSGIVFGTLVPKGPFINVSVLSSGERPVSVKNFLSYDIVREMLPERYERACGCQPRAATSSAGNYFADRFVTIGDAAVSRLYKDGIGSSLLTARQAVHAVVNHGLSYQDFARYYQPFCNAMTRDNHWGRLLFALNNLTKNSRTFVFTQHRLIGDEQGNMAGPQPFTRAIWGMFTGSYRYGDIARMVFAPSALARYLAAFFIERLRGLFSRGIAAHRILHVGSRKVLILGSGFGGTYVLRRLVPSLNRNENVETTMVSDENFFMFSPLLHEVAMGRIETRHIAYPIRRLQWRDRFNFVQATVEKIDLEGHKVVTTAGTLEYDYLILALGSVTDTSALGTIGENVFTLKTLHDSRLIRNHIIGAFERASVEKEPERQKQLLTFVVSGAGYTGVQLVTELRDFIYRTLLRFYKKVNPACVRIILVEAESKIVSGLHSKLGAYVMKQLQKMGIEVKLKSRITRVWEDGVEINGRGKVPAGTLIWVAGVVANPRIAELEAQKDRIGRVMVDEHLELPGFPGVYAVGDCAHFEDPNSGKPIPPLAHNAVRQAKVVAYNILADIRGRDRRLYRYSNPPEMVSLGTSKAVFRINGLRFYGFVARLIWLVGYSSLITGTYNRIRIIMDWLLSLVFGRDTTFIKMIK